MPIPSLSLRSVVDGVAAIMALAVPAGAQKVPDTRVNTDPPASAERVEPQIAASGSSVYVSWEDGRAGPNIYFNRSLDAGASWLGSDIQVNRGSNGAFGPKMSASGSTVYVIWEGGVRADIYFNRSLDGGLTWLPNDVQVSRVPAGSIAQFAEMAVVGSDVYVVWEDDRFNGATYNDDIYFNRSLDGGLTWMPFDTRLSTRLAPATADDFNPVIAASGTSVFVTWTESTSGSYAAYFRRSLDQGTTWSNSRRLATLSGAPDLAAVGSTVYLVWSDGRNGTGDIYFNRSLDGGTTWLPSDVRVNTNPLGTLGPQIPKIAASGSSVYVCWTDWRHNSSITADIYFNRSLDGGLTWLSSDIRINTEPPGVAFSGSQQIAASGSSVYVTWDDARNFNGSLGTDIYLNRSLDSGTTWLASDVRLNTEPFGTGNSLFPQIAATGASAYVTWVDDRNWNGVGSPAKGDIYFNIPFGFQPYGTATPGSGGLSPMLSGTGSATIGSTASVDVTGGLGSAAGALFLGVGPASKISIPVLGGTVLVQPTIGLPLALGGAAGVPGAGTASLPLSLPNDPAAVGVNLNFQGIFLDVGAILGISMSNAIEMWIG